MVSLVAGRGGQPQGLPLRRHSDQYAIPPTTPITPFRHYADYANMPFRPQRRFRHSAHSADYANMPFPPQRRLHHYAITPIPPLRLIRHYAYNANSAIPLIPKTIAPHACFVGMENSQIVTFTLLHYKGLRKRWWGLQQMGLAPQSLAAVPGQRFAKMLGSGAGKGFSIFPNFGVYGLLIVWETEDFARDFFRSHPLFESIRANTSGYQTFFLRVVKAHGAWDGQNPFEPAMEMAPDKPIAVLTRATIAPSRLWQFWAYVPPVSASIQRHQKDLLMAIGIGELPLIQQATFSLWRTPQAMMEYAYQSPHHKGVVRKTRELNWYSEELFARFQPFDFDGNMDNPLGEMR